MWLPVTGYQFATGNWKPATGNSVNFNLLKRNWFVIYNKEYFTPFPVLQKDNDTAASIAGQPLHYQ